MTTVRMALVAALAPIVAHAAGAAVDYVCDLESPEDLVAVAGDRWIITSGLQQGAGRPGHLYAIDRETARSEVLFPTAQLRTDFRSDLYPECPGPLDSTVFSAHGINVAHDADDAATLFVINHGDREAVEVFRIESGEASLALTWIGCIVLPEHAMGNGVAPLPEGGLAVTMFLAPEYLRPISSVNAPAEPPAWLSMLAEGETTGYVSTWRPDEGWQRLKNSDGSGPNGIETAVDGSAVWVAYWGDRLLRRIPLSDEGATAAVALDFRPDNLRWGDDGQLWTAGATGDAFQYFACWDLPDCRNEYAVARIDPERGQFGRIELPATLPDFGDATTALNVDNELWLGAHPSQCVARFELEGSGQ